MNSALNIVKIILLSIIAVALVFLIVILLGKNTSFKGFVINGKSKLIYDNTFTEEIKNIDVYTTSNDVKIIENEKNEINVKVYDREENEAEVSVENDTLKIVNKQESKFVGFFFSFNNNPKIVISIPKDKTYNLIVNGTSSDITSALNLGNVNISTKSGDIELKDAKDVMIKSVSGDIELGSIKNLDLKTTSGDINIDKVDGKLSINTTSGDISVRGLNLTSNSSIKAISGDVTIGDTNDIYVDTSVISGDVKVNNNNRHAKYELKIKTTSGDISVNN